MSFGYLHGTSASSPSETAGNQVPESMKVRVRGFCSESSAARLALGAYAPFVLNVKSRVVAAVFTAIARPSRELALYIPA